MGSRIFHMHSLQFYGGLLLLVLKCYAQTTSPTTGPVSVLTTQASIITNAQTSNAFWSTLAESASHHKTTAMLLQFVSNNPRRLSYGTVAPIVITAEAMEGTVAATTKVEWDGAISPSISTESPKFESVYGRSSLPKSTADAVTTSEVPTRRTYSTEEPSTTHDTVAPTTRPSRFTLDNVRAWIKQFMRNHGTGFMRKILKAEISPDCSFGLLKFARAIEDLEPWALRLIDATAKYPTGLFQATIGDLGAYDECIETVVRDEQGVEKVRGQYCDLHVLLTKENPVVIKQILPAVTFTVKNAQSYLKNEDVGSLPGIRFGLCIIDACDEQDLASIARSLVGSVLNITVKDCVTSVQEGINITQASIIASLVVLAAIIAAATAFEVFTKSWNKNRKKAIFYQCIVAFSALANTRLLLTTNKDKNSETYRYQFIHGLRFLSLFWICLGHSYLTISENMSRLANGALLFERWESPIISVAYLCVDTFFFLSGYLLYDVLNKQNKNHAVVAVVALFRRFYRTTIPLFFVVMCMYLLPLIASGPNSKEFYDRFYAEVRDHWWDLLVQVYNWRLEDLMTTTIGHLWYLSADYQLFVVAVIVIQVLGAKKWLVATTFAALSLVCCGASAWRMYGTHLMPFVVAKNPSLRVVLDTSVHYYMRPYYHGVCFFFGCITFILVEKYRKAQISKTVQASLWGVSLFCGLYCIFMKLEWNRTDDVPPVAKRMFFAFVDRILWTVFLVWLAFSCITGRGGYLTRFLSWSVFAPLARLSFGVYLIHLPFYLLTRSLLRERFFISHYTMVSDCFSILIWSYILSYFLFIACEAPVSRLDKLVFLRGPRRNAAQSSSTESGVQYDHHSPKATVDLDGRTTQGGTTKD